MFLLLNVINEIATPLINDETVSSIFFIRRSTKFSLYIFLTMHKSDRKQSDII